MRNFEKWLSSFKKSIANYSYYADFAKIKRNVDSIKIELNILNSLIGSKNIEKDFENIIKEYPKTLKCIPILLAVRANEIKIADEDGCFNFSFDKLNHNISKYKMFLISKNILLYLKILVNRCIFLTTNKAFSANNT